MNAPPRVSVVIPTHNRPHTLPRAIHSVLQQGYRDIEVVVVDDASKTDAAAGIVAGFAVTDPRVRYIRRDIGGGAAAARNTGIEAALGEFIAFQDDDDEWLPGKLDLQMALMTQLGADCHLVGGALIRYTANAGGRVFSWPLPANSPWVDSGRFVDECSAFLQTAVIRKSALQHIGGFNPEILVSEDFEMALRLLDHGRMAAVNDIVVAVYEQGGASLTGARPLRVISNLKILELHARRLGTHPRAVSLLSYEASVFALLIGQRATAVRLWFRSLKANPRAARVYMLMPLLVLPADAAAAMLRLREWIKKAGGR